MTLPKGYKPPEKKSILRKCRENNLILGTIMSVIFGVTAIGILFGLELLTWQNVLTTVILTTIAWVVICYPAAYFIRMIAKQQTHGNWKTVKVGAIVAITGFAILFLLVNAKFVVGDMYGRNEFFYVVGYSHLDCPSSCEPNYPSENEERIRAQIDNGYTIVWWLTLGATMIVLARMGFEAWRNPT